MANEIKYCGPLEKLEVSIKAQEEFIKTFRLDKDLSDEDYDAWFIAKSKVASDKIVLRKLVSDCREAKIIGENLMGWDQGKSLTGMNLFLWSQLQV